MLRRNVFTKTLHDLRWPTFWAGLALFAIAVDPVGVKIPLAGS